MAPKGRKPKGQFSGKLANFSTRIQPETRKALEKEAKATGKSISQLAELLLVEGLAQRKQSEDKALKALCFLISEIAFNTTGIHRRDGSQPSPHFDWRSDPFFYRAFTIACGRVINALKPPGEIVPPTLLVADELLEKDKDEDGLMMHWFESFETPEARGEYIAGYILRALENIPRWSKEERERRQQMLDKLGPSFTREFYGIPDAVRDLAVKPREKEKIPTAVAVKHRPFMWTTHEDKADD